MYFWVKLTYLFHAEQVNMQVKQAGKYEILLFQILPVSFYSIVLVNKIVGYVEQYGINIAEV